MATTARCCFVFLILGASVQVQGLRNFRAVGEYLRTKVQDCSGEYSDDSARYFEETYYSDGGSINKTALRIDAKDDDAFAFFGDLKQKEVFSLLGSEICDKVTFDDPSIPHFSAVSFESEASYAPVYITLAELRYLINNDTIEAVMERGMSSVKAELNLKQNTDEKYYVEKAFLTFEDVKGESYDPEKIIPLAVEICIMNNDTRYIERLSIVSFAWDTTVEEDTSPPAGVACKGYGRPITPEMNVFDVSTLVLRTEQVLGEIVTTGDIALDFERNLLRVDNGVNDYFFSKSQKLVYNVANPDTRIQSCEVSPAMEVQKLNWTFVDFAAKNAKDFFGVTETSKIKTRTKRRGIECDLISGSRDDYLPQRGNSSLWEWCIARLDTSEGIKPHMVHLDIYMQNDDGSRYQESYSLYDVESVDQKKLYADYFTELEPCFDIEHKLNLQVIVDGPKSDFGYADDDIETAIESGLFKAALLDVMLKESGLSPDSYRFGSTEAYILESREAVFQFWLLDAPENEGAEDQRVDAIFKKLQERVAGTALTVDVNGIKFTIQNGTLTEAHDMDRGNDIPVTKSPVSSPVPDTETTTENDDNNNLPPVDEGIQGALVWGVAFAVLLVGGGVGVVAGNKILTK